MKPVLAVVIPTRNRGSEAVEAARAVLQDPTEFELVVVDQSDDDQTVRALGALAADARLRVVRSSLRGASNARNLGTAETSAPIIAFTDDDCRPEPGWASSLLRVFADDPGTELVFGRVVLPETAASGGFAATFEPKHRVPENRVPLPDGDLGISANLAIRRTALDELGGFDPLLGPGAPFFKAGEDIDVLVRALHGGYRVVNASECEVVHLGVRTGPEVRKLVVGYHMATGAAFGKHARLTGFRGATDILRWAAFFSRETVLDVARGRRPHPGIVCYFLAGVALSFRYRLDRSARVYRTR